MGTTDVRFTMTETIVTNGEHVVYEGTCPKCGTKLRSRQRRRTIRWPQKEWDAVWHAFDRFMGKIR